MKATLKRFGSIGVVGKSDSGHWVPMDTSPKMGGHASATGPMELILIGLGGCTAMDVLSILSKKRVKLDDFEVEVEADRAEEHPKTFQDIRVKFIFYGSDIREKDVARAIELSEEKYCAVAAMLRDHTTVTSSFEIRPAR